MDITEIMRIYCLRVSLTVLLSQSPRRPQRRDLGLKHKQIAVLCFKPNKALCFSLRSPVRQAKSGQSSNLKGGCHVNYSYDM